MDAQERAEVMARVLEDSQTDQGFREWLLNEIELHFNVKLAV